jgi:hypothetical protein
LLYYCIVILFFSHFFIEIFTHFQFFFPNKRFF